MASNSKRKGSQSQGTVLIRQAEPKYKFVGKKLPKQPDEISNNQGIENRGLGVVAAAVASTGHDSSSKAVNSVSPQSNSTLPDSSASSKMLPNQNKLMNASNAAATQGNKPVAVVGASMKSKSISPSSSSVGISQGNSSTVSYPYHNSESTERNYQSPTGHRLLPVVRPAFESNAPNSMAIRESSLMPEPLSPTVIQNLNLSSSLQTHEEELAKEEASSTPVLDTSAAAAALSEMTHEMLSKRLVEAEMERDKLKKDFAAQLQVNGELKRLLVASVGDDLGKRVERLAQDRVQLSMDIGGFSKKMTEDYENLDKMSIQADMWRSKYLASRVMVEELGNARAYFSLQWHESQEALQQMLNERHELRTNLLEAYKILQQVKDAFDPLNSHRSSSLASTNVLDLSRACQQLGEAVRFRLLPAHVATSSSVEIDFDSWADSVTRAEQYAHELLSRPSQPSGSLQSGSPSVLPIARSPHTATTTTTAAATPPCHHSHHIPINRFHPQVRHENVTYHCCKCKGEITVV